MDFLPVRGVPNPSYGDIMKKSLISAVIICVLVLTYITCSDTCQWPQYLANPQRTGYIPCNGPDAPEILWKANISGQIEIPPIIAGDTLLVMRAGSYIPPKPTSLMKINLFTGEIENQIDAELLNSFFDAFSDGINIFIEGKNDVWRIDADQNLESVAYIPLKRCGFRCHPIVLEDKIVCPTTPLFCFSRPDFEVLWNTESILPDYTTTKIMNAAASKSYIFVITRYKDTKEFYALHIDTGEIAWNCTTPHNMFSIAVDESIVFVGGDTLCAFDIDTGNLIWEVMPQEYIHANLIVGPEYIFAADHGKRLYAMDKKTGKLMWTTEKDTNTGWIFLAGGGAYVYCTAGQGEESKITCFLKQDGTQVWEYVFDQEIHTYPALSQGILVVALLRGDIYAFATEITDEPEVTPSPSKTEPPETSAPESTPPDTVPPGTEPSQSPPPGPEPARMPEWYLVAVAGIIIGILGLYTWQKRK
jgi:outer membrane protein assembly factor BamB